MNAENRFQIAHEIRKGYQKKGNDDWVDIADHLLEVFDISVKERKPHPTIISICHNEHCSNIVDDKYSPCCSLECWHEVFEFPLNEGHSIPDPKEAIVLRQTFPPIASSEAAQNKLRISELERVVRLLIDKTK